MLTLIEHYFIPFLFCFLDPIILSQGILVYSPPPGRMYGHQTLPLPLAFILQTVRLSAAKCDSCQQWCLSGPERGTARFRDVPSSAHLTIIFLAKKRPGIWWTGIKEANWKVGGLLTPSFVFGCSGFLLPSLFESARGAESLLSLHNHPVHASECVHTRGCP